MPTALITGASAGLGAEFARQLAADRHDVILVARSADRLDALAEQLRTEHGIRAEVIVEDLIDPAAPGRIAQRADALGLEVDLLVNNAGFGSMGRFEEIPDGHDRDQLLVNVVALTALTRALIPGMLARGHGAVLNVASTAAYQPAAYFATYTAGKSYVLNFSLALRAEYRKRGIKVLAFCPGPTRTEFFDKVGERAARRGRMMEAAPVVAAGLRALRRDRAWLSPGLSNKLAGHLTPRRPRTLTAWVSERVTRKVLAG